MTAAARYLENMRMLWPRWDLEPFDHYTDDGPGGEPGLERLFGPWRDTYLRERFPVEFERIINTGGPTNQGNDDEGTFRLGASRLRPLLYLFCPFVYGRDWESLSHDRREDPPVPLPVVSSPAEQEARVAIFLGHLDNLQSHFERLTNDNVLDAPPFHDPALLVAISLHEGGVTTALTSDDHRMVPHASNLSSYLAPDDNAWDTTLRNIHRGQNLHSFYDHGLDHLGQHLDEFRSWGWIPPQYDNDGSQRTWLYEPISTLGPIPARIYEGEPRRRTRLADCYPGNAYHNYDHLEGKCFNAAVLPRGDIFVAAGLTLWRLARRAEQVFRRADLFPGESLTSLPKFLRRLIILFAFGSSRFRRPASVRREAELRRLVARMARPGRVPDMAARHKSVGSLLRFLKELAAGHTAAETAAAPSFYTELYAQFAFTHSFPRNRFWRAYVADLLDKADVLRAPRS